MLAPGSRLGRYEIRSLLGVGGMGEVYLAHDAQLQRPVALKMLAGELRNHDELRLRLENEARAASALNHPNILTVYDVGAFGDDHYIATEYVDGITLRQRMLRGEASLHESIQVAIQIASALAAAEEAGLVHRDIKPDNIMIRRDGYVKLLDFGLARLMLKSEPDRTKSEPNLIRGTIFYMSPEQLRGAPLDVRSDIWSTGVLLYELLTGRLPFEGDSTSDVIANILRATPPPLTRPDGRAVPTSLASIVATALAKRRNDRYPNARALLSDLQRLENDFASDEVVLTATFDAQVAKTESLPISAAPASNLPLRMTPLVGRECERADVLSLLRRDEVRLVTLTGPGGTGKTRLSLAVGTELLHDYDDGVWWVSLESIRDPRLVIVEIAAVLGVKEGGAPLLDAVKNALRARSILLILDNCEQVLDAAPAIGALLADAPRAKALVTSRAPLHISGEREYAVPPLAVPPAGEPLASEELAHFPAVALFVERASAVKSDFTLTPENAQTIAEICASLDGLPLAIELAAARVKVLPPKAMLARMQNRLAFLSGGLRDLPARQQTMRAAISWGYNLLDDDEKRLFSLLSVFCGGFTIESAERLAHSIRFLDPDGVSVLDGVSSLLDKAFLRGDPDSSDVNPRFVMLETIREYGLESLGTTDPEGSVPRAHAALMAAIAEENELDLEMLSEDEDNFRSALERATTIGDAELSLRLCAALWWSWYLSGHYAEGRQWIDRALAVPGGEEVAVRAKVLTGAAGLALLQCEYERAIDLLDSSIALARASGDPVSLARSLQFRGSVARERGDYASAIRLHEQSLSIWEELEDRANAGRSLNYIGFASWLSGDCARAVDLSHRTLDLFRSRNDVEGSAWSLLNLAAAALHTRQFEQAEQLLDECLSWARTGGFREGVAWSLNPRLLREGHGRYRARRKTPAGQPRAPLGDRRPLAQRECPRGPRRLTWRRAPHRCCRRTPAEARHARAADRERTPRRGCRSPHVASRMERRVRGCGRDCASLTPAIDKRLSALSRIRAAASAVPRDRRSAAPARS